MPRWKEAFNRNPEAVRVATQRLTASPKGCAGKDSRKSGCEKGFSHQRKSGREKGFSHQRRGARQLNTPRRQVAARHPHENRPGANTSARSTVRPSSR